MSISIWEGVKKILDALKAENYVHRKINDKEKSTNLDKVFELSIPGGSPIDASTGDPLLNISLDLKIDFRLKRPREDIEGALLILCDEWGTILRACLSRAHAVQESWRYELVSAEFEELDSTWKIDTVIRLSIITNTL